MSIRTRLSRLMLSATLVACAACQRARAPESFIPADAAAVLSVPRLDQALGSYKALAERFVEIPAVRNALLKGEAKALKETGIDLDRIESIRARGLNPQQGLYVFLPATADRGCLVTAVLDRDAADVFVRELLRKVTAKGLTFREARAQGLTLTEVLEEGQTQAELAYVHHRKSLLVCASEKTVNLADYVATVAQAKPEQGLLGRADFQAARVGIGNAQFWAYIEASVARKWLIDSNDDKSSDFTSTLAEELQGRKAFAAGLDVSGQAATLRVFLHGTQARAAEDRALWSGQGPAPDFVQFLPLSGNILLIKASANIPVLTEHLMQEGGGFLGRVKLEENLAAVNQKLGFDLRKDILALLAGRFLIGFDKLGFGLDEARKAEDPMAVVPKLPAYLLAQVNDRGKAAGLLASIERRLRESEIPVDVSGTTEPIYTVSPNGRPLLSFGLLKDVLVVSTADHFPKLLEYSRAEPTDRAEIGSGRVSSHLRTADSEVLYVDLVQTAALLHAVTLLKPDKEIDEILPVLDKLRDVALLSQGHEDGSSFEFQVRLR